MTTKGILLAIGLGLIGALGGFVAGRSRLDPIPARTTAVTAAVSRPNNRPSASPVTNRAGPRSPEPARSGPAPGPGRILTFDEVAAALSGVLAQKNPSTRFEALQKIAGEVDVADIPKVLALAQSVLPRDLGAHFGGLLLSRWAESDPAAAMTSAQSLSSGQQRNQAILNVLGVWARHDSAGAIAWYQQLPLGPLRNQAGWNIVSALAQENPQAA